MKSVFITRELEADSVFARKLRAEGYVVSGHSLLQFQAVPFGKLPSCDWIFFYSRQGVAFFFEKNPEIPAGVQWAALGEATATQLGKHIPCVHFTGNGDPLETSLQFLEVAAGKRVLFPRARQSKESIARALAGKIEAIDLIVYDNIQGEPVEIPDCEWLVFTSPLNASAYFSGHIPRPHQKVLAIGKTTEAYLKDYCSGVYLAESSSEASLADFILLFKG